MTRRCLRIVVFGIAALAFGPLAAFADETCPLQCASGTVPLGVALPLSGPSAAFGKPTAKAIQIAVGELNQAGGLLGIPVDAVVADDRCDAGTASDIAARHIESRVRFVIGPSCPAVAMDASQRYAQAGIVQFVPTVTGMGLVERNPGRIFRMVATDEQEAEALAAYLAREQKGKKLAVVFGEFFYRRAIARMIDQALSPEQKKLTHLESLADVSGAYDRLADKLAKNPPDIIYVSLDAEPAAEFIDKLRERGVKSLLFGGQHLLSASFWRTHRQAAESIRVITPIDSLDNPSFRQAAERLLKDDVIPDIVALSNYAAVQTWAQAVTRAGNGDPGKVIEVLRSTTFPTAVGNVAFDAKGNRRDIQYSVMSWEKGRPVPGAPWSR